MRARKTQWLWLAAVLIFVVALVAVFTRNPGPAGVRFRLSAIPMRRMIPVSGPSRCFRLTNNERVTIMCRGVMSEIGGGLDNMAPTINPTLPRLPYVKLKPGEETIFAIGQPTDTISQWRIHCLYESITFRQRVRYYALEHAGTVPFSWLRLSSFAPQLATNTSAWIKAETR